MDINQKLNKQFEKYGSFEDVSAVTDGLLMVAEGNSGIRTRWARLTYSERQCLRGLLTKIGRLLSPELNTDVSVIYEDIAGYAMLGRDSLLSDSLKQPDMFQETEPTTFRQYSGFDEVSLPDYERGRQASEQHAKSRLRPGYSLKEYLGGEGTIRSHEAADAAPLKGRDINSTPPGE